MYPPYQKLILLAYIQIKGSRIDLEQKDIKEILNNPLKITKIKYDSQGFPSIKYIGHKATVVINPETGKIII